ncbi:hypothetical protein BN131_687 [Cronobacter malonaticus 681]|nr:hypothetical protein BN131_687 [Cronobacter malonaticus 681]
MCHRQRLADGVNAQFFARRNLLSFECHVRSMFLYDSVIVTHEMINLEHERI